MNKTSAQKSYLQYLRNELAAQAEQQKEAVASCGASHALAKHKKKMKKATITKEAQGYGIDPQLLKLLEYEHQLSQNPMLIDADTQRRLSEHNRKAMRTAGGILGGGAGALGGGALGAGIGALASQAGKRLPGAGWGALAGGAAGGLLGGLLGPGVGEEAAGEATSRDVDLLNQMAQQRVMQSGMNPFGHGSLEGMKTKATFGKNTGDPRAFALEEFYRNMPQQ